ncbi:MAG: hypothetical protein DYH08_17505, partial [Actinobacteria bacterium ATB1]|nr:hypothetical protein [Actinobacteria bacterium ATB1]
MTPARRRCGCDPPCRSRPHALADALAYVLTYDGWVRPLISSGFRVSRHRLTVVAVLLAAALASCSPPGEGGGESRRFTDDDHVRIGIVGAFSGDLSYVGNAVRDGVLYAVDVRNAKGGLFGGDVEVVKCDGEFRPSTEKTCLTKLVD